MGFKRKQTRAEAAALLETVEAAEDSGRKVKFVANPTQKLFIEHRPFEGLVRPADWPENVNPRVVDLFSCRMGEGKSAALCWSIWYYTKHNPGAAALLLRDTWENLRQTTLEEFFFWFPPGVAGEFRVGEKKFVWYPETGLVGSVQFLGADDEKDAGKLQSRFYGICCIDEPSPSASTGGVSDMVFTTALGRLRQQGMQWYAMKLAQNNPDETHWTYQKFVDPGTPATDKELGFTNFQTTKPENTRNLPPGYYEQMTKDLEARPDLQRRFVKGEFGFQQLGVPVCPKWDDGVHLLDEIPLIPNCEMWLSWDGGLTPVCVIGLVAPSGVLLITDAVHESDGGTYQLIEEQVYQLLQTRYKSYTGKWQHTGDPALEARDPSDATKSPVLTIKKMLGGRWTKGPTELAFGIDPLNRRLGLLGPGGKGMIVVDRKHAKGVYHALRGGWHYAKHLGGTTSPSPVKNHPHSDYGDAMRYLAGTLFPRGELRTRRRKQFGSPGYVRYSSAHVGTAKTLRTPRLQRLPEEFREIP